jgi:WD40-like Beta Propeller Repeat
MQVVTRSAGAFLAALAALAFHAQTANADSLPSGTDCATPAILTRYPVADAIGSQWNQSTQTLAYGRRRSDGHYAVYVNDANGSRERPVQPVAWPADRHEFPVAWHPSGRYLMATVEEPNHPGSSVSATPGYGGYSNYWLVTPDGRSTWRMTDLPQDKDHAITHAAFSSDGSRFIWTERIGAPRVSMNLMAGSYRFNVSIFVDGDPPQLTDTRSYIPGGSPQGGEVESIASDNRTIAFYSTFRSHNLLASRIYTMDTETGAMNELTTDSFAQAPRFTPDGRRLVFMTGKDADIFPFSLQGADWWIMHVDGTHKQRLTYMNKQHHLQSDGHFKLAGSLSFVSDNDFFGDVMTKSLGLTGYILHVQLRKECIE